MTAGLVLIRKRKRVTNWTSFSSSQRRVWKHVSAIQGTTARTCRRGRKIGKCVQQNQKTPRQLIIISVYTPALITALLLRHNYIFTTVTQTVLPLDLHPPAGSFCHCTKTCDAWDQKLKEGEWRREPRHNTLCNLFRLLFQIYFFSPSSLYHTSTLTVTLSQLTTTHFLYEHVSHQTAHIMAAFPQASRLATVARWKVTSPPTSLPLFVSDSLPLCWAFDVRRHRSRNMHPPPSPSATFPHFYTVFLICLSLRHFLFFS